VAEDLAKKPTVDGLCGCGDAVARRGVRSRATAVRLPAAPNLPADQTVELVFAPLQSAPSVPVAQAESPTPPVVPETPAPPPEQPVSAEPPPLAEAPAPTETLVPPEPPAAAAVIPSPPEPPPPQTAKPKPQPVRPPVAEKSAPRTKAVPSPRSPDTPTTPDIPANQQTSGQASADAPIAGDWRRSLASWFATHKTYPEEARRRGTEGSAVLRFTADRTGRVLNVVLVRSAGSSILDAAAESLMRNATLPPFTSGMTQETVTVTVQLRYSLTD
jgi:periplasmic protein TonB